MKKLNIGGRVTDGRTTYQILSRLGKGGYGEVYRCKALGQKEVCALKVVSHKGNSRHLKREVAALKKGKKNEFIVSVFNDFRAGDKMCIVMELAKCSLHHWLEKLEDTILECEIAVVLKHISEGLRFLHDSKIVYRDLKPENILVFDRPIKTLRTATLVDEDHFRGIFSVPMLTFKVGDFGLAREEAKDGATGVVGTVGFTAPELARGGAVEPSADIYSFGIVLFHMLTHRTESVFRKVQDRDRLLNQQSRRAVILLNGMTCPNPKLRYDVRQVSNNQFLIGDDNFFATKDWDNIQVRIKNHIKAYFTKDTASSSSSSESSENDDDDDDNEEVSFLVRTKARAAFIDVVTTYVESLKGWPGLLNAACVAMSTSDEGAIISDVMRGMQKESDCPAPKRSRLN